MVGKVEIITVDADNVDEQRFFCYKSKPKTEGYRRKLAWLRERFAEGMKIKIVYEDERSVGFVEYIPGEVAWRAVEAAGYMVIHCLWVVGKGKKKGYGSRLLEGCVRDARASGLHGVAMVTSSGNWLAGKKLLLKNGFEAVDQAPPTFDLLVKRFGDAPLPAFPTNWDERLGRYGSGLTIVRSDQCPYIESVTQVIRDAGAEFDLQTQVVELESCQAVQESAPSAYGVFNVVYDGELVTYHWLGEKELRQFFDERLRKDDAR
ncbi:MAG: GNAT family N-acetyltransferase [Anaerolineae bacterium]|nr:GNAT family N-acetyltransferase [Anaerolineae bacterium]